MIDYRDMALKSLVPGCQYASQNNKIFWDVEENNGVACPSQEEISLKIEELKAAEPIRLLRVERNRLLSETDWWAVADRTMTAEQTTYRTALRDLPENSPDAALDEQGNLINVTWPTKPE